jgi:hypothetical protein
MDHDMTETELYEQGESLLQRFTPAERDLLAAYFRALAELNAQLDYIENRHWLEAQSRAAGDGDDDDLPWFST